MIEGLIDKLLAHCRSQDFQQKLQSSVLDPVLQYLLERLYPYILAVAGIFFLTFIFVALILILVVHSLFWKT